MPVYLKDMSKLKYAAALLVIGAVIAIGSFLRFDGNLWDDGHHLHPDERFLAMVVGSYRPAQGISDYFDTQGSKLNPNNVGHNLYVYGTWPTHLVFAISQITSKSSYGANLSVGRRVSAAVETLTLIATVALAALVGLSFQGILTTAVVYGFMVLPLQLSHFMAVDPYATLMMTLFWFPLLGLIRAQNRWKQSFFAVACGVIFGLALSAKISSAVLAAPVALVLGFHFCFGAGKQDSLFKGTLRLFECGVIIAITSVLTFRVFQPYAFLGLWSLNPVWTAGLKSVMDLSKPSLGFPPAVQWIDREFLFGVKNLFYWGAGPLVSVFALVGVSYLIRFPTVIGAIALTAATLTLEHAFKANPTMRYLYPAYPLIALLCGHAVMSIRKPIRTVAIILLFTSSVASGVAFTAIYRRPVTRVAATEWIYNHLPSGVGLIARQPNGEIINLPLVPPQPRAPSKDPGAPAPKQTSRTTYPLQQEVRVLGLYIFGFPPGANPEAATMNLRFSIANQAVETSVPLDTANPTQQVIAFHQELQIPAGMLNVEAEVPRPENSPLSFRTPRIFIETHWDDVIPMTFLGVDPNSTFYEGMRFEIYVPDSPGKVEELKKAWNEADFYMPSSNRQWGSVGRLVKEYPYTTQFWADLLGCKDQTSVVECFSRAKPGPGGMNWSLVQTFTSYPSILGMEFDDSMAEEAFTVYDHPRVMIFARNSTWNRFQALLKDFEKR